ncbi:predicted protein [Naegleria gruberi]|uniref:Predicted protein n=1 Tax=Naegleria gruberi TaxID=5762 RepID=D2VKM8_NAEGR|nr:uncharacterized protein NAEGRDRAFT_69449 [Naegleria gruberi]EFC42715.1 predicted protein [Naegleria gruberi]|eukprot:XP_002675459.1 predicted protein [Naegleria gruberi strain NEG-M]
MSVSEYSIKKTLQEFKEKYGKLDGVSPQFTKTLDTIVKWEKALDNGIGLAKPPHVDFYMNYVKKTDSDFQSGLSGWYPSHCDILDKELKVRSEWVNTPNVPDFLNLTVDQLIQECKNLPVTPSYETPVKTLIDCFQKYGKLYQYLKLLKDYYCALHGIFNPSKEMVERQKRANTSTMFFDTEFKQDWDFSEKISAWLRPCEIADDPQLFFDGIDVLDIRQSSIGTCYFLAAVINLAYKCPRIIKNIFVESDMKKGKHVLRLYKDGKETLVTIDDRLPFGGNGKLLCSRSSTVNEFWVPLLEKAFAKLYGGYKAIGHGGQSDFATATLCGARPLPGLVVTPTSNPLEIWKKLVDFNKAGNTIFVYSPQNYAETEKTSGIKEYHAYAVLEVVKVEDEQKVHRLVKIMNPWGFAGSDMTKQQIQSSMASLEWKGRYSDNSSDWTPYLIKRLNVEFRDDGIFYMCIEDFVQHWKDVKVNALSDVYDCFY